MRQLVSKITMVSVFVVAIYLLFTAGLVFYSVTCTGVYCGLGIVLPVMPWILLLESVLPGTVWTYFSLVIVNSIILYFITRYLYGLFNQRDHRKELQEI